MAQVPDGDSQMVMRAMELVGSSPRLAKYLYTTSQQVIRWMLGRDPVPAEIRDRLQVLLHLPADDLARALHMTADELEVWTRRQDENRRRK